jgi:hypothetical protein
LPFDPDVYGGKVRVTLAAVSERSKNATREG